MTRTDTGSRDRHAHAVRIDGRAVGRSILAECLENSRELVKTFGVSPHLSVVLVGDDPASAIYVGAKQRACADAGVESTVVRLSADSSTEQVTDAVRQLAADEAVHGIIVQLPMPAQIDPHQVLGAIPVEKDADGFHLYNVGSLLLGRSVFPPCTPEGVMRLLDSVDTDLVGANVVVVGASNVVGKPMAMMALHREATVTICHARTRDLAQHTRTADVLICAAGRPGLITGDMVKEGVVVIDVGINRLDNGKVTGDVDFDSVARKASYITPVPGGVGPMTVAVLISNTVRAAARAVGLPAPRPDEEAVHTNGS